MLFFEQTLDTRAGKQFTLFGRLDKERKKSSNKKSNEFTLRKYRASDSQSNQSTANFSHALFWSQLYAQSPMNPTVSHNWISDPETLEKKSFGKSGFLSVFFFFLYFFHHFCISSFMVALFLAAPVFIEPNRIACKIARIPYIFCCRLNKSTCNRQMARVCGQNIGNDGKTKW